MMRCKVEDRRIRPRQHGQRGAAHQLRGTDGLLHQLHQVPPGMGIRGRLYGNKTRLFVTKDRNRILGKMHK